MLKRRKTNSFGAAGVSRPLSEAKEETKYFDDYEWSAETIDLYTAPSLMLNTMLIPQGVGAGQRLGNRIFMKRLFIRLMFEGSASQQYSSVRFAVVRDSQPMVQLSVGRTPAQLWSDIWTDTGNATSNMVTTTNIANNKRFKVIRNEALPMVPTGAYYDPTAANPRYVPDTKFLDVNIPVNEMITYQGSSNLNPIAGANFYVFAWSDTNANTTKVWASTRLYFTDA